MGSCKFNNLILSNVRVVLKLTKNVLSVSKFTHDNHIFMEFWPTHYVVKKFHGKTILYNDTRHGVNTLS